MRCPVCGVEGAYVGFTTVECLNKACRHFVPSCGSFLDIVERILSLGSGEDIDVAGPMQVHAMGEALEEEGFSKAIGISAKEWKANWMNLDGYFRIRQFYYMISGKISGK